MQQRDTTTATRGWERAATDLDATTPAPSEGDLAQMLAAVHGGVTRQKRGVGGWLRTRPTWLRRLVVLAALAVPLAAATRNLRANWQSVGALYLAGAGLALAGVAIGCAWLATRPLQRRALSQGVDWGLFGLAVVTMLGVVLLGDAPVAVVPAHGAGRCAAIGVLIALPALVIGRLVDRGAMTAPLLMATAAALMANVGLLWMCPVSEPTHCVTGHVAVALWLVVLVLGLGRLLRRR